MRHIADRGVYAGSADHAVSEALYLTDPDGLGIEIYADRPRAAWRLAGRELYMTTEPLDLARPGASRAAMRRGPACRPARRWDTCTCTSARSTRARRSITPRLGFDQVVWSYPGALFLSAGGYHHHLGTNTWAAGADAAPDDEARLLEWDLVLPDEASVEATARSLHDRGYAPTIDGADRLAHDPWGTAVRSCDRRRLDR